MRGGWCGGWVRVGHRPTVWAARRAKRGCAAPRPTRDTGDAAVRQHGDTRDKVGCRLGGRARHVCAPPAPLRPAVDTRGPHRPVRVAWAALPTPHSLAPSLPAGRLLDRHPPPPPPPGPPAATHAQRATRRSSAAAAAVAAAVAAVAAATNPVCRVVDVRDTTPPPRPALRREPDSLGGVRSGGGDGCRHSKRPRPCRRRPPVEPARPPVDVTVSRALMWQAVHIWVPGRAARAQLVWGATQRGGGRHFPMQSRLKGPPWGQWRRVGN